MNVKQSFAILLLLNLVLSGLVIPVSMTAEAQQSQITKEANLDVYSERVVGDSVETITNNNGDRVYSASGQYVEIETNNFNQSEVIDKGVDGSQGILKYDNGIDRYVLNSEGVDGTYVVYWTIQEEVDVGNSTELRVVRYESRIQMSDTNAKLVQEQNYKELESDASKWRDWESKIIDLFGEDVDVQAETNSAYQFLRWRSEAFLILGKDITVIISLFVLTWGGRFTLIILLALVTYGIFKGTRYYNRREKQDPYEQDILDRESHITKKESEQMLQGMDFEDVFDVNRADMYREATDSNNMHEFYKTLSATMTREYISRLKLNIMNQDGYSAAVKRTDEDGIIDARIVDMDEYELEENESIEEIVNVSEEMFEAVKDDDMLINYVIKPDESDPTDIEPVIINDERIKTLEDLISLIDDDLVDNPIDSKKVGEDWARALDMIRKHPSTDENGALKTMRSVLNDIVEVHRVVSDKHDVPLVREQANAIEYLLYGVDVDNDVKQIINESKPEPSAKDIGEGDDS